MNRKRLVGFVLALSLVATLGIAVARAWQEQKKQQEQFPLPQAGPEHQLLKKDVGVWDAVVEFREGPDGQAQTSKGVETNTLMAGGLWLITDYKGDMGGQAFQGHGMRGYDPKKGKYVGTWADSMSAALSSIESTYDAATKTMTGWMESLDPSGKPVKVKEVVKWNDDGTRELQFAVPGPDGKDFIGMRIKYTPRGRGATRDRG